VALTRRQKKILKWGGYPLLALVVFVFTLHWTFPYGRLKEKMVDELSDKYDVSISSVEPKLLPGGIEINRLMLRPRPKKVGEDPPVIMVKKLELDASLLSALRGRMDVDIDAQIGSAGTVSGNLVSTKAGLWANFSTTRLSLEDVPGLKDAVGMPMSGPLNAEVDLHLPKKRWREAEGFVKLSCPSCTAGDGVTKIKPRPRSRRRKSRRAQARMQFIGEGIPMPPVDMGNLSGRIDIKAGKGVIKEFAAVSPDGEMNLEGEIDFRDPFKNSTFPGCLKFKFSEDFNKREPKFSNIGPLMGASIQPDGFVNMRITGTLANLRFRAKLKCKSSDRDPRTDDDEGPPSVSATPSIKIIDDNKKPTPPPPGEVDGPGAGGPQLSEAAKKAAEERERKLREANGTEGGDNAGDPQTNGDGDRPRQPDDVQPGPPEDEPDDVQPGDDMGPGDGDGDMGPGDGDGDMGPGDGDGDQGADNGEGDPNVADDYD
jgi:type II secretion system protein N